MLIRGVVVEDCYIMHSDIDFLKNTLPEYPDEIEEEPFYKISEETLKKTPDEFEKVVSSTARDWLAKQSSWLLIESQSSPTSTEHLEFASQTLREDLKYVYGGRKFSQLNGEQQLDVLKRRHKIKAIERLISSRNDPKARIVYPNC